MHKLVVIVGVVVLLTACSDIIIEVPVEEEQTEVQGSVEIIEPAEEKVVEATLTINDEPVSKPTIKDGVISVELEEKTLSFLAGLTAAADDSKMNEFEVIDNAQTGIRSFTFAGLNFGKALNQSKTMQCDGEAVLETVNKVKVAKCEMEDNTLIQYECTSAKVAPDHAGSRVRTAWKKVYLKEADDQLYAFAGIVPQQVEFWSDIYEDAGALDALCIEMGLDCFPQNEEEIAQYADLVKERFCSEDYLTQIVDSPEANSNIRAMAVWDELVSSFEAN